MKIVFTYFTALFISQTVAAQQQTLPLYPSGKIPNYQQTNETEKRDTTQIVRISRVQEPTITVFLPPQKIATGQAVIICPGGGYAFLAYDWEGTSFAHLLTAKGIAAIVLKYRLPNSKSNIIPYLSPLMDAKRAIRMVRYHAPQWNIEIDNIGIMGFSAGGHLASTLATHFDDGNRNAVDPIEQQCSRPDFAVLIYPVISMSKAIMHTGSRNNLLGTHPDSILAKEYSNETQVTKQTPPTFLLHAMDDKTVPVENSLLFYQAMKDAGVSGELHVYPRGGHGFALAAGKGYLNTWTDRLLDWLNHLKSR